MKSLIGSFVGLLLGVSVSAEPLLEGRVRLESGQPVAGVQVRLFDLTNLHQSVSTTTDQTGHFTLSLPAFAPSTALPQGFALGQNYPNPFNPSTIIPYQIPTAAHVRLEVFNLLGQRIATLVDAEQAAGAHTAQWTATDKTGRAVGAGVYIYRLVSGGATLSRRMVLIDGQAGMPAAGAAGPELIRATRGPVEADGQVWGLTVAGAGLVAYVNPAFRVGVDEVEIVLEAASRIPRMKVAAGGILGDVNNDGQVDVSDVLYVLLYSDDTFIVLPNNGDISLGDVNGDSRVDVADVVLLVRYLADPSDPSLPAGIGEPVGATTTPASQAWKLYWTDVGTATIQRSNLDGSGVEDLVTNGLQVPTGLALDVAGGKLYWTDYSTATIQRSNLDGSRVEDLVTKGLLSPTGLALDVSGGKMYWTDVGTATIQRSNLDGSDVEDLVTNGLDSPVGLALDVSGGKMYWTDRGTDKIQRSNLDGSGVEDLVTTGLRIPWGLALDVSGGKMYWTDVGTEKIQRSNLDGSRVEDLVTNGLDSPTGLALDVAGGKLYWTDYSTATIQRSNLDGSGVEDLLTRANGLGRPAGLALGLVPVDEGEGGDGSDDGDSGGGCSSDDHSNTRPLATVLALGSSQAGEIETGSDVDYFKVQVGQAGTLTVYTTGSLDTKGTLEDNAGATLTTDDDGGDGTNFRIERAVSAGTYYVKVESYSSRTGSYTIHASVGSSDGGGGGGGGGGACFVGQVLSPGQSCTFNDIPGISLGSNTFRVTPAGQGCVAFICSASGLSFNTFGANKISGTSNWRITSVP